MVEHARATCPCCGYPTINGRAALDICPLCGWEDDGQDDADRKPPGAPLPDAVVGGVNHDYSLSEARENFAQYVTMYRPTDRDFEHERAQTNVKRAYCRSLRPQRRRRGDVRRSRRRSARADGRPGLTPAHFWLTRPTPGLTPARLPSMRAA